MMLADRLTFHAAVFLQLFPLNIGNYLGNIAVHKPAKQSSTFNCRGILAHARLAVDGKAYSTFSYGSCSHTLGINDTGWWEVDLQKQYRIDNVRILNRDGTDCEFSFTCADRLHDVSVNVYQTDRHLRKEETGKHCKTHTGKAGPGWLNLTCESPVTGRYVSITKPENYNDPLTLCEVEIYEAPEMVRTGFRNFKRSATQVLAQGDRVTARSNLDCGTTCARTTKCIGFYLVVGEDGNNQCHILTQELNEGGNSSGGMATFYHLNLE